MTQFPHDEFAKNCLDSLLSPLGTVEISQQISSEVLDRQDLERSADLYAEVYSEDGELQELTAIAGADWPERSIFGRAG
jgi:hypothetical protein